MIDILAQMRDLAAACEDQLCIIDPDDHPQVTILPGSDAVLDFVGNGKECAQITLTLVTMFPSATFPDPAEAGDCATDLAYQLQLGIFRCAPTVKGARDRPVLPTPEEQIRSAERQIKDAKAAHCAIRAQFHGDREYVLGEYTPYGPEGGVVGGSWSVTVGSREE